MTDQANRGTEKARDGLSRLTLELEREGWLLGRRRTMSYVGGEAGRGFVREPSDVFGVEDVARGAWTPLFVPVAAEVGREVGFELACCSEVPQLVRVTALGSTAVRVLGLQEDGCPGCAISGDDPGTVFVDLRSAGPVAVLRVDGRSGIVVGPEGDEWVVVEVASPLEVRALADVMAPLAEWLVQAGHDPWLEAELRPRLSRPGPWEQASAAGLMARLYEPATPEGRAALVEGWRAGRMDGPGVPLRAWVATLGDPELDTLRDLVVATSDRLAATIEDLEESMAPAEPWWQRALLHACLERDEIESVLYVLDIAGRTEAVQPLLESLDAAAERFVDSIPRVLDVDHERLRRVRAGAPDAWWATIGRE